MIVVSVQAWVTRSAAGEGGRPRLPLSGIRAADYDRADTLSRRILAVHDLAVPVMAIIGRREMRDGRVSLRERDGSQVDVPLAEAVSGLQARARPRADHGR
jgi:threonyl-tRNA synthetase